MRKKGTIENSTRRGGRDCHPFHLVSERGFRSGEHALRKNPFAHQTLEAVAFYALVLVVALRPLIAERYDSAELALTTALEGVSDPSPVRTAALDFVILCSAFLTAVARALGGGTRYRRTGLEWGTGLVAAGAVVSTITAGHKRLALNASLDWLCLPVLAITLAQLMTPWRRRVLIGVILGSACVQAAQCLDQYVFQHSMTWERYQQIKEDLWARQGVELDSPKVELFERRILSRESIGFLPHSNVAGSYLVLCQLTAAGMMLYWLRYGEKRNRTVAFVAASAGLIGIALMTAATYCTSSIGAWVSAAVGVAFWGILVAGRSWWARRRRTAFVVTWLLVLAGLTAVAGYGLYFDSLPGASLSFRWEYWKASAGMISDYWFTGVGRENFAAHYLRYKSMASPEEISSPHNLFVQAACEWGIPGLTGIIAMLLGASAAHVRYAPPGKRNAPEGKASRLGPTPVRILVTGAAFCAALSLFRLPLLGSTDAHYLYYNTVMASLCWMPGFLVFASFIFRKPSVMTSSLRHECSPGQEQRGVKPADRETACNRHDVLGAAAGITAFLVHEMINFALFVPGTATTLFAVFAFSLGGRLSHTEEDQHRQTHDLVQSRIAACFLAFVLVFVVAVVLVPVARAAAYLDLCEEESFREPQSPAEVARFCRLAGAADPLDPTPYARRAHMLFAAAQQARNPDPYEREALRALDRANRRDPFRAKYDRMRMAIHLRRGQRMNQSAEYDAAIEAAKRVLARYPQSPDDWVALGRCQLAAGLFASAPEMLRDAIASFDRALELDHARPNWEVIRRFNERRRREILDVREQAMERLEP